jgi:octaprenyl-diphosphate synthase
MGSVIPLKKSANSAYLDLKNLVNNRLIEVEKLIEVKLDSKVSLIKKMSDYHLKSGGKRLRALLTLGSAKLAGYDQKETRDVNLSACVELIHSATLLHDDVIDESDLRRGIKTPNALWGNQSSILVGDYLLSRCFEIMVDDGDLEILKLLSSTSSKIAQGEVKQLEHKGEADLLEETYIDIINLKTAALFSAATKTGACLAGSNEKEKSALESYGKNIGLAFQIADDALDYYSKEIIFGKKIGKDFYEGKVTLEFIKKYKAVEDSLQRAEYFVNVSHDALGIFKDCNEKKILQNLTGFSLNRSF